MSRALRVQEPVIYWLDLFMPLLNPIPLYPHNSTAVIIFSTSLLLLSSLNLFQNVYRNSFALLIFPFLMGLLLCNQNFLYSRLCLFFNHAFCGGANFFLLYSKLRKALRLWPTVYRISFDKANT